jgi:hypothetical protein
MKGSSSRSGGKHSQIKGTMKQSEQRHTEKIKEGSLCNHNMFVTIADNGTALAAECKGTN